VFAEQDPGPGFRVKRILFPPPTTESDEVYVQLPNELQSIVWREVQLLPLLSHTRTSTLSPADQPITWTEAVKESSRLRQAIAPSRAWGTQVAVAVAVRVNVRVTVAVLAGVNVSVEVARGVGVPVADAVWVDVGV
jgi:hypothetical protein